MFTIVVIEEDAAMRALILEWLAGEGRRVLGLAALPPGGLTHAEADIVVADIPNLRSDAPRTVCKAHQRYPSATLIGVSTQLQCSLPGDSELARTLGVRCLIPKPCERDELVGAVNGVIISP